MDLIDILLARKLWGLGAESLKQSDWNQNDPNAPDYVKNRPFYSERVEKTIEANRESGTIQLYGFPEFEVGDIVTVKINDVEYNLEAFSDGYGGACIGDSPEEFGSGQYGWFVCSYRGGIPVFTTWESNVITYFGENVIQLPNKYIKNHDLTVLYLNGLLKDFSLVETCSDNSLIYRIPSEVAFVELPQIGVSNFQCLGLAERATLTDDYVVYSITQIGIDEVRDFCFVHSDEGVQAYKADRGLT